MKGFGRLCDLWWQFGVPLASTPPHVPAAEHTMEEEDKAGSEDEVHNDHDLSARRSRSLAHLGAGRGGEEEGADIMYR